MHIPGALNKKYLFSMGMVLLMATFSANLSVAQVSSSTADHVDTLSYLPGNNDRDPLFVFYNPPLENITGTLTATYPQAGSYNFEWRKYNPVSNGFDPVFNSETNVPSSTVSGLDDGAYQVRIWDGSGIDTSMLSWVMLDRIISFVEKNAQGNLPGYRYTCDYVSLAGYVFPDTLLYHDLLVHQEIKLPLSYSFRWTSDNNELDIPNDTIVLRPNTSYKPPYKDTEYYLSATDQYGMTSVDTVFYESIQTKAEFDLEYLDKVTGEYDADLGENWEADMGSLDARLTIRFLNRSLNGSSYEWVYLDTLGGIKQEETTYDTSTVAGFTYEAAGKYYYPYMVSHSEAECTDTFSVEGGIHVVPSQLAIPNVFSPDGIGDNNYFVFKHQSLKTCRVTIVDRSGMVVYKKKIDDIYAWQGWDGNMHESSRRAPEGQYYYIIEALGYDDVEYRDPNILESWKLNRGNKNTGTSSPTNPDEPTAGTSNNLYTGWLYLYRMK